MQLQTPLADPALPYDIQIMTQNTCIFVSDTPLTLTPTQPTLVQILENILYLERDLVTDPTRSDQHQYMGTRMQLPSAAEH